MNRKIVYVLITFVLFFFSFNKVKASCSYTRQYELSKMASNVKVSYSVSEEPSVYFTINIFNLTEDIFATVTNNYDALSKAFSYNTTNLGNVNFESYDIYNKIQYKVTIKSLDTECSSATLRTISIVTPRYNPYYSTPLCEANRDYSLCYKWSDYEISFDDLKERVNNYKKEQEVKKEEKGSKTWLDNIFDYIKSNYILIASVLIVVVIAITITIIIVRKRRKF